MFQIELDDADGFAVIVEPSTALVYIIDQTGKVLSLILLTLLHHTHYNRDEGREGRRKGCEQRN